MDTSVEIFGVKYPNPIFVCPTGGNKAYHPEQTTRKTWKSFPAPILIRYETAPYAREIDTGPPALRLVACESNA